ncbi:HTH-type transcriptional regulator HdfR [Motilimonas pumila]|uniref:HTH-type transcriptional regulator HdfR n=1 Tax=Motilimonas pumila TaxID=2303987 RepID=A0A418YBQ2_9GAMM|nr:HTH-type transcriptional regulator HdfR [Motilimonas pumila]RJG41906.1 HTH-type transcriptional regulator HdfR [Motilimonas pumila]
MDTELLKTFLEVSHTRHFGKAAENLYLTPSAVSFRIKQLEGMLGVELFKRHRNNIQITPAGNRMLPYAETMLNAWSRAKQDIALAEDQSMQLSIGAAPNLWDAYLQPYIHLIHEQKPDLTLRAEVLSSQVMARQLLERRVDLALAFDPPKVEEVTRLKLQHIALILVTSDKQQIQQNQQLQHFVNMDWGTAFKIQHIRTFESISRPVLHTGSARIALDFLLHHPSCAFLPRQLVQPYLDQGLLFTVQGVEEVLRPVFVNYLNSSDKLEQIEAVIELLSGHVIP